VPNASYTRNFNGVTLTDSTNKQAIVNGYFLDKFEVSVGRVRNFVAAYDAWRGAGNPAAGAGAHPLIANSGWQAAWSTNLPATSAALITALKCDPAATWTDTAGANEGKPANCLSWYESFAFCAWDAGRMPTEAEWNLAGVGGNEHRVYPWSVPPTSTTLTSSHAIWNGQALANTGAPPSGGGRWGQRDLAGSLWEWNIDTWGTLPFPCTNCANLAAGAQKLIHGGSWATFTAANLQGGFRTPANPVSHLVHVGVRCARN
jgi:formylglycine-generating enzyme required for sulfatase activity